MNGILEELSFSSADDGALTIELPFLFPWRGTEGYSNITVTTNGMVWLGEYASHGCCDAAPVNLGGVNFNPRIAVAQEDLTAEDNGGKIYAGSLGTASSYVVSWEGLLHLTASTTAPLYFQTVLYPSGQVELRWGDGEIPNGESIAAGLDDDRGDMAAPATGQPFDSQGSGVTTIWPNDQCRTFVVARTENDYVEYNAQFVTPSSSAIPSQFPSTQPTNPATYSKMPTWTPSASQKPSTSMTPSFPYVPCGNFTTLANTNATRLPISDADDERANIILPFLFPWMNQTAFRSITVDSNGFILLGQKHLGEPALGFDVAVEAGGVYTIPRIAVAQADLDGREFGDIFLLEEEETVTISWENIPFWGYPDSRINAQVRLHALGNIDISWGTGDIPVPKSIAAGVEDDETKVLAPVTGIPFTNNDGLTEIWPTFQCRRFVNVGDNLVMQQGP